MKSENSDIEVFFAIILALLRISEVWSDIRERISNMLENVIDELSPEAADRLLSIAELLDEIRQTLSGRVEMRNDQL